MNNIADKFSAGEATIILAGATGSLGRQITEHLCRQGARVKALVRPGTNPQKLKLLQDQGAAICPVDFTDVAALTQVCRGGTCVVSALSGLREVIVTAQTRLLEAAVAAGVPRFIPSDFAIDFTRLPTGTNRNLDWRREFAQRLDQAPIRATSVLNGMFTDLLIAEAPVVIFPFKLIVYWGSAHQPLDFTTLADTAAYTAAAALDPNTPRYLRVAGDVQSAGGLKAAATDVTGKKFRLFRVGGLKFLASLIKVTRLVSPQPNQVFPPWQGMQYLHNMLSGQAKLQPLDNDRYPDLRWTSVREVLAVRAKP